MHDNLHEFTDPVLDDSENRWGADDECYRALAREVGGPVLDVACGTGRLTRALAAAGLETTGVDIVPAMLDRARALATEVHVDWIQADCRALALGRIFRLLTMTSHGFQYLLTDDDQDAFLDQAHHHLEPGGILAFETRNPLPLLDGPHTDDTRWSTVETEDGRHFDLVTTRQFDQATMIADYQVSRRDRATGQVHRTDSGSGIRPMLTSKQDWKATGLPSKPVTATGRKRRLPGKVTGSS